MILALSACVDAPPPADGGPGPIDVVAGPTLSLGPARGARLLEVELDRAAPIEVTVEGPEGARSATSASAARHAVPVVGFRPGEAYVVRVEVDGAVVGELPVTGDPAPAAGPDLEVLAHDPTRTSPGWTLFTVFSPDGAPTLGVMLDDALLPVWWTELDASLGELVPTPDGTLLGLGSQQIVEIDWLGNVVRRLEPGALGAPEVHHEVIRLDGGDYLVLGQRPVAVDAYPLDYGDPRGAMAPATIQDNVLSVLGPDGALVSELSLAATLDTTRIGYGSLEEGEVEGGLDWVHANGVAIDPADGARVVSLRHQDALVKLSPEGEVLWLLGDPAGWEAPLADRLLEPVGPAFRWPYHAHAPEVGADGHVLLFDNGNVGHTPYTPATGEPEVSRVVELAVDEGAGTVALAWEHTPTTDGPLFSVALGDADRLANGNVLGCYGFLTEEAGVPNLAAGRGSTSARLVEVDPADGATVLDLRISSSVLVHPLGFAVYRAERLATVPPDGD